MVVFAVAPRRPALLLAHLHQHVVPVLDPGRAGLIEEQTLPPLVASVTTESVFVELYDCSARSGYPNVEVHRVVIVAGKGVFADFLYACAVSTYFRKSPEVGFMMTAQGYWDALTKG